MATRQTAQTDSLVGSVVVPEQAKSIIAGVEQPVSPANGTALPADGPSAPPLDEKERNRLLWDSFDIDRYVKHHGERFDF
jgi:hypothetical protein